MRIQFNGILLAASDLAHGRVGPAGMAWNSQPVIDVAQLFRAVQATVYGRGDGPEEFSFSLWREFATEAEAMLFCGTHRAALPLEGALSLVDDEETAALLMAGAVREVRIDRVVGVAVHVTYKFTGASFVTDDVPAFPEDPDTVKTGIVTLAVDDATKAIVFALPFATVPNFVTAKVIVPTSDADGFDAWPIDSTITAAGFEVKLGALVPAAGYELRWMAVL